MAKVRSFFVCKKLDVCYSTLTMSTPVECSEREYGEAEEVVTSVGGGRGKAPGYGGHSLWVAGQSVWYPGADRGWTCVAIVTLVPSA